MELRKSMAPRNPLVVLARRRRAGAHASGTKTARQRAQRALRNELGPVKGP